MIASRSPNGFTLVELLVTIAVAGILFVLAAPSFNSFIDKYRAKRAADTLSAFLINAKTEAIKRNAPVRAVFQTADSGATWCAGMTTAGTCDCTVANACQIDGVDRLVRGTDFKGIVLTSPADEALFSFTPQRGTANSGNAQVQSSEGLQVRVIVTGTGRIRLCSPSGSGNIAGYPVCS
jgi:type IV fimbrial biogenesis protein FimT